MTRFSAKSARFLVTSWTAPRPESLGRLDLVTLLAGYQAGRVAGAQSGEGCRVLDPYSKAASAALLQRFPEWAVFVGSRANPDGSQHLVVAVPRPLPDDPVGGLVVDTAGGEMTVECGQHYHSHFDDQSGGQGWDEAFAFIAAILDESLVCARYERGGAALGGTTMTAKDAQALRAGKTIPEFLTRSGADSVWLWSWRGTADDRVAIG